MERYGQRASSTELSLSAEHLLPGIWASTWWVPAAKNEYLSTVPSGVTVLAPLSFQIVEFADGKPQSYTYLARESENSGCTWIAGSTT